MDCVAGACYYFTYRRNKNTRPLGWPLNTAGLNLHFTTYEKLQFVQKVKQIKTKKITKTQITTKLNKKYTKAHNIETGVFIFRVLCIHVYSYRCFIKTQKRGFTLENILWKLFKNYNKIYSIMFTFKMEFYFLTKPKCPFCKSSSRTQKLISKTNVQLCSNKI